MNNAHKLNYTQSDQKVQYAWTGYVLKIKNKLTAEDIIHENSVFTLQADGSIIIQMIIS